MYKKINLAIFSPFETDTETFIKAHKSLPFNIYYFYGGLIPHYLEGVGNIWGKSIVSKGFHKLFHYRFSYSESRLIRFLKKKNINCVLAEYGPTAVENLKILQYLGIPLVVHFHGYDASKKDILKKYGDKYTEVFNYAHKVVVVSKAMKKELIELGSPEVKIEINPYGPQNIFSNSGPRNLNTRFIFAGRFVDKKAPYYTIKAFAEVNKIYPETELVMIGNGPLWNTCKNLVKYLGVEKNVILRGSLPHDEVQKEFQNSFAYVQHSIIAEDGDSEGTPVSIMEAQASGLPVISTLHAGIPDVVINGQTGLLSAEHDVKAMTANMLRLLNEPDLAKELGVKGSRNVNENFSLSKHIEILAGIIKAAVENRYVTS